MMVDGASPQMLTSFFGGQFEGVDGFVVALVPHAQKKMTPLK